MSMLPFAAALVLGIVGILTSGFAPEGREAESYPLHHDSQRHVGVPKGMVTKCSFSGSELYPGTVRDYWVYVPDPYDGIPYLTRDPFAGVLMPRARIHSA